MQPNDCFGYEQPSKVTMSDRAIAIVAFLICYVVGFQIALSGPNAHAPFFWVVLFVAVYAIPSFIFVALSYILFVMISWWATVLLSVSAIAVYFYAPSKHPEAEYWNMALAVIIATTLYQLLMLPSRLNKQSTQSSPAPPN
jgi:hypothetical protein